MKYRAFPGTRERVSALGMGCMRLPTREDGSIDRPEAIAMIRHAIDSGVNYVDTAWGYHGGDSEVLVGEALRDGYREKTLLATKLPVWLVEKPSDMREIFEKQLKRLGLESVDVYHLHALDAARFEKMQEMGALEFLAQLKREGRIRYAGFSFHDSFDVFQRILSAYDWDVCQVQMNVVDEFHQATLEGVRLAAQRGIGVIAMEPLRGGSLSRAVPREIQALYDAFPIKRSAVEWALRWMIDKEGFCTYLSGMSNMEQLNDNLRIFDSCEAGCLTQEEKKLLTEVREAYERRTPVGCTGCSYCQPCPQGVKIPEILQAYDRAVIFEDYEKFYTKYFSEPRPSCVGCCACESVCPQHFQPTIHEHIQRIERMCQDHRTGK